MLIYPGYGWYARMVETIEVLAHEPSSPRLWSETADRTRRRQELGVDDGRSTE
jgi:hypothetical protein